MSECQTKALTLSFSQSLSFTHSRHTEQLLFSCLCSKVTRSLSHYLTISLSQCLTLTLSLSHSLTHNMLNNCCFHVYAQKSLSHSHYLIISLSHSLSVDMLNNFCLHVYAQKSVLIAENCDVFFWTTAGATPSPVTSEFIELVLS